MTTDRTTRFVVVASMVALFVSGVGVGFAIFRMLLTAEAHQTHPHARPAGPIVERFADEIGLRREQREGVHAILEDGRARAHHVMAQNRPELERIRKDMEARIEALLDAEQANKYRELRSRVQHGPDHPPHGRHPPPFGRHPPPHDPPRH